MRGQTWETVAFRGAVVVALVHAIDDAFVNRQPGVALGQHALAAAVAIVAGVAAIAVFPRMRPGLRSSVCASARRSSSGRLAAVPPVWEGAVLWTSAICP